MSRSEQQNNMKHFRTQSHTAGFTLVETLIAIAILAAGIGALLTLSASGFFSIRYSRNDIVANNLLQESLEYIRNTRDTQVHQGGATWDTWLATFNVDGIGNQYALSQGLQGCFAQSGCRVDAYLASTSIKACSGPCPALLFYPDQQFYGYTENYPHIHGGASPYTTSFVRTIRTTLSTRDPNQLIVTAMVTWDNGTSKRSLSQSMILTNWQL